MRLLLERPAGSHLMSGAVRRAAAAVGRALRERWRERRRGDLSDREILELLEPRRTKWDEASASMKILLVSPFLPYPPVAGGHAQIWNWMTRLSAAPRTGLRRLLRARGRSRERRHRRGPVRRDSRPPAPAHAARLLPPSRNCPPGCASTIRSELADDLRARAPHLPARGGAVPEHQHGAIRGRRGRRRPPL